MILKLKFDMISFICGFTTLSFLGVNVVGVSEATPFQNPFVYFFVFLGVVMTLGKDYKDKKRRPKLTWSYVLWSVIISVGFSTLVALAWRHQKVSEFYAYCLIIGVSAFAPMILDKFTDDWTDTIGTSVNDLIKSFFNSLKRKWNGTDNEQ